MGHAAQSLQGCNVPVSRRRNGDATGSDRVPVHDHRAGSALGKAAAELGSVESQVVAQDVEERRGGVYVNGSRLAIHFQRNSRHSELPFFTGSEE